MKTKILLSTIAILFVAVLYLLYLNLQKSTAPIAETQLPSLAPTKTIDQTAGWKTYENKQYGFSFKYPDNFDLGNRLMINDSIGAIEKLTFITLIKDKNSSGNCGPYDCPTSIITYLLPNNSTGLVGKQFVDKFYSDYKLTPLREEDITVGNFPAIIESGDTVFVFVHNKVFVVSLAWIDKTKSDSFKKIFPQILSTFKFTNSVSSNNWIKRPNGDFQSANNCLWISTSKANDNGDLEQYIKNQYRLSSLDSILNQTQYQVKDHQSITISAQGIGEIFTVYFPFNEKKYSITFSAVSQETNLESIQCQNSKADINYVLNNVDLFI